MASINIDRLLKKNPKARRHSESIRKVLGDIQDLREAGLAPGPRTMMFPYEGRPAVKDAPQPSSRKPTKGKSKLTVLLERSGN